MDYSRLGFLVLHYLLELLEFMSIESVVLSNHLILCYCPLHLESMCSYFGLLVDLVLLGHHLVLLLPVLPKGEAVMSQDESLEFFFHG